MIKREDVKRAVEQAIRTKYDLRRKPENGLWYAIVVADNDIFAVKLLVDQGVLWRNHTWTFPIWRESMPLKAWRGLLKEAPGIIASAWDENAQEWDKEACLRANYVLEQLAVDMYYQHK